MVLVIAAVVFFFVYARQSAREAMFQPLPRAYERSGEAFESMNRGDGIELNLFWGPSGNGDWTVFYFCGSDEDLAVAMPRLQSYVLRGFNVISFDYRGYGHSSGSPSESNLFADASAIYDYLVEEKGILENRLVLHGRSIGGGVATELAVRRNPAGLILESTFTSVYDNILGMKWVPRDLFQVERKARKTNCPVLIIHGVNDSIVDVSHSAALAEAFGQERVSAYTVADAGHRNVDRVGGLAYWTSIERFIRDLK